MKNGDISNQRSYAFGFRVENSLLTYRDRTLGDKIVNFFVGKTQRAVVNERIKSLMNYIYWNTEYTVFLVIDDKNYTDEAKEYFKDLPYNQVVNVKSVAQITMMLNTGEMAYYVDESSNQRSLVNSQYAVSVDQFERLLRKHYGRLT